MCVDPIWVYDEKQLKQTEGFIDKFFAQMVWRACLHACTLRDMWWSLPGWQPVSTSSQENNTLRPYVAKEFSRSDQHNWAHRTANQLLWKECPRQKVAPLSLISQRCKCHLLERIFALCNMWQWTTLRQWWDVLAEEQLWQRSIIGVSACPPVWSANNGDERVHNYYGDVMNDCIFGGKTLPFTNIIDNIVY